MKRLNLALLLIALALAAPAFGQTTDTSTWNGGTGFWNVTSEWTTNGQLGTVYPNNTASTVFNVTIDSGQQDIVTLAGLPPITINSLTLDGNPNFSSTLEIGVNGGAPGMLTIVSNSSAASLTVNSLGNLDVNAQSELLLNYAPAGIGASVTVTNNGAINLNSASGTGSSLLINNGAEESGLTLNGTGTLTMQGASVIQGVSGGELVENDSTIQGAGTISNLDFSNNGAIVANSTTPLNIIAPDNGSFQNTGTLTANSGSTMVIDTTAATNAGNPGFTNQFGAVSVQDGGILEFKDTSGNTASLGNEGGSIDVGGTGAGGTLEFDGSGTTFDLNNGGFGTGMLTLSDNANNLITGVTGTETFINDTAQTLSGAGTISNLDLVNNGTIIANGTNALDIVPNASTFVNNGTLQANSGSTLVIDTTAATNAHAPFGGFLSKGTAAALDGGTLEFEDMSGGEALLGNFGGGAINVGGAGAGGTLEFDGKNTQFDLSHEGSNEGGGTLTLSDNANNVITGVTGTETFINDVGETLSGAGTISNLALVNNGTIIANGTNALNINPNSSGFTNNGTVQVNAGSTLNSSGVYTQDAGQTHVNGTLIASSLAIKGGTLVNVGIVETQALTNGASITAEGFIGVGSGNFTPATFGYQQLANGTLDELIYSLTSFGTTFAAGQVSLDGTLDVSLENGFIPTVGDQFAFLDFTPGDLTGTFATFLDQTFDGGLEKWGITYNSAGGDVFLTTEANTTSATPEPAPALLIGTGLLGLAVVVKKRRFVS